MAQHHDALLIARMAQPLGDQWVHGVRKPRSEMVLDLEVEATHQPMQRSPPETGAAVHVDGGAQLVADEIGAPPRSIG